MSLRRSDCAVAFESPAIMALRTTLNWFSTSETRSPEMTAMTVFSKPSFS